MNLTLRVDTLCITQPKSAIVAKDLVIMRNGAQRKLLSSVHFVLDLIKLTTVSKLSASIAMVLATEQETVTPLAPFFATDVEKRAIKFLLVE